jgi:hypothetical protein
VGQAPEHCAGALEPRCLHARTATRRPTRRPRVLRTGFHCDYEQADLTNAQTSVWKLGCSCHRTRFQILLESEQLAALRRIQERTTAPVASQIRRAVENWVAEQGEKTERKRPASRARP